MRRFLAYIAEDSLPDPDVSTADLDADHHDPDHTHTHESSDKNDTHAETDNAHHDHTPLTSNIPQPDVDDATQTIPQLDVNHSKTDSESESESNNQESPNVPVPDAPPPAITPQLITPSSDHREQAASEQLLASESLASATSPSIAAEGNTLPSPNIALSPASNPISPSASNPVPNSVSSVTVVNVQPPEQADRLRTIVSTVERFAHRPRHPDVDSVVTALRDLAELMVWADQHSHSLWDLFMELGVMPLLVRALFTTQRRSVDDSNVLDFSDNFGHNVENQSPRLLADVGAVANGSPVSPVENGVKGVVDLAEGAADAKAGGTENENLRTNGTHESREGNGESLEHAGSALNREPSVVEQPTESTRENATRDRADTAATEADFHHVGELVQSQVLQTLSIIVQSVTRQHSLLCVFSTNHINDVLSFKFNAESEEVVGLLMSVAKTIALKLDPSLLQLFFDPKRRTFPLYTVVSTFFNHRESMVRIAVRNVTLTLCALGDSDMLDFVADDDNLYLQNSVDLLVRLCGSAARALELVLDDGREVTRTLSRTGIFRRSVRMTDISAKLVEIENLCAYLGDVAIVAKQRLRPVVSRLVATKLFAPLFRPLATRASPKALRLQQRRWGLSRPESDAENKPAIALFDAAARSLLLTCILTNCKSTPLSESLIRELGRPTLQFEGRNVFHALKAMCADIGGTERMTFISLCAMEAIVRSDAVSPDLLRELRYDLLFDEMDESLREETDRIEHALLDIATPDPDDLDHSADPMVMTLTGFEGAITPSASLPVTPRQLHSPHSAKLQLTDGGLLTRATSTPSIDSAGQLARAESEGILSSFQLGEAALREVVSSVVLVVRRREVRSTRVVHVVSRLLLAAAERTNDFSSCADVAKIVLDEVAGGMLACLRSKRTTIVAIELMFERMRLVSENRSWDYRKATPLLEVVSAERAPSIAAECPEGVGRRRRVGKEEIRPPIEMEDAVVLFAMMDLYETASKHMVSRGFEPGGIVEVMMDCYQTASRPMNGVGKKTEVRNIVERACEILRECELNDTYLDKRDALESLAEEVVKYKTVVTRNSNVDNDVPANL